MSHNDTPDSEPLGDEFSRTRITHILAHPEEPLYLSDLELGNSHSGKIKIEDSQFPWSSMPEMIDLCDDDSPNIKKEGDLKTFSWTNVGDRIIEVSDSEDEELELTKVKEEPKIGESFDWTSMGDDVIDVEGLAKRALLAERQQPTRRQLDPKRMAEMSRLYAQKALSKCKSTGAKAIFSQPKPIATPSKLPTLGKDGVEWMAHEVIPDEPDLAEEFRKLKEAYKAKRKARKNTFEDDIEFKRAEMKNNERKRRLEQDDASDSDSTEAQKSDDGHCPLPDSYQGLYKRLCDEVDDGFDLLQDPEALPPNTKQTRRVETSDPERRTRARNYRKNFDREELYNQMAGIEAIVIRDQLKEEDRVQREAEKQDYKGQKGGRKRKSGKSQLIGKRTRTGRMTNIQSLVNGSIFDDSIANQNAAPLPQVSKKKKVEFLSSIIANIPKEMKDDIEQAEQDKRDILASTRLLMPRGVTHNGDDKWAMKGMKTALYHHQVQGAACMKTRELSDKGPYGGILADSMGLGKTVITIATMVANRQKNPDEPRCTLIVCSPALMKQWESELEAHADARIFRVINRYYASESNKTRRKGAEYQMESSDVLLTTYGEVVRSYPMRSIPRDLKDTNAKLKWWEVEWNTNRGFLHRAHFYRIVLDEAQIIKNHASRTSIACRALMAKYRWAISGTPIQNRLDELYPFFKFLRVRHTGSIGTFRQNFCLKNSDVCNKRLVSIISGMMIRRSHDTKLLGCKLLDLPEKHQKTITIKLNSVERFIYLKIKARCIRAINAIAKEGEVEKETKIVLIMFQRLRQMVAHIFMVQDVIERELKSISWENIWTAQFGSSKILNPTEVEETMVNGLEKMLTEKDEVINEPGVGKLFSSSEEGALPDEQSSTKPKAKISKSSRTLAGSFGKHLRDVKRKSQWSELRQKTLCQYCGTVPEDPQVTSCYHLYCKECLHELALVACRQDLDRSECYKCGFEFHESAPCSGLKELDAGDFTASGFAGERASNDPEIKRDFKQTMKHVDRDGKLLLSSKIIAVKEEIASSLAEDSHRKIIVFTEWHMVMHLVGRVCQQEGWNFCHYNGKISLRKREQALCAFSEDASIKVLVASLKCGGTGLNLTAASKVICVDLWFNSCVEQQAFCRVHRIGQTKETYITRIRVADTIDESLIKMQEEKKEIIGAALDDKSVLASLTTEELMSLFGPVAHDENSRPFIMIDDDEMLEESTKKKKKQKSSAATNEGGRTENEDVMEA